jgi:hypothetical protein
MVVGLDPKIKTNKQSKKERQMSIFANIESAPVSSQQRYFQDGTYVVTLHKFVQGSSRRDNTPYVAVECTITEVTNEYENSNKVGERVSWVVMMRQRETFLSAVKGFVAAAAACAFEDVSSDMCEELSSGDGSAVEGLQIVADANTITTLKGNPFMKVIWRSL